MHQTTAETKEWNRNEKNTATGNDRKEDPVELDSSLNLCGDIGSAA